jgi:tetratricopeptide (TPR) repeat protein
LLWSSCIKTNLEQHISTESLQRNRYQQALNHFNAGRTAVAVTACEEALKEYAGDANLMCLAAKANLVLKHFDNAKRLIDEAVRQHPDFAVAHDVYGDLLLIQGQTESAVKAYEQAMRLDPTRSLLLTKIENARELTASTPEALSQTEENAVPGKRMAFGDEIHNAQQRHKSGEPNEAEKIYRGILKRDPNHIEAARLLAGLAVEKNQYRDAEVFLRHAASNAPDYGRVWIDLTNVLREQEKLDEAMECALKVLEMAPDKAEPHMLIAGVAGSMGRHEDAIEHYEKALEISAERPGAMSSMAHHLKTIGRQQDAVVMYRKAIEVKPDHSEAYWSLANLKTFRFAEDEVQAMHTLLNDDELPDESRVHLNNALGLHYEAHKDFDRAFLHLDKCNFLRRQSEIYDPVETEAGVDQIIKVIDAEFIDKHKGLGNSDDSPILIVGLPRSGSTLIEQILASHSQVDGTFELADLPKVVKRIRRFSKKRASFPGNLLEVSPEHWKKIGQDYIDSTQRFRADAPYFIDKNPNNFIFIGLLRIALPGAKIINATRHPLDSCFGTYKQLFASGQPFSYDLTELGEYYVQYQRLMDHWNRIAPGFSLDVRYEDVVGDLEGQVRRILDFCNLPYEENCLRFHETERAVKTASSEQVRQPIYSSSVNLWRNYESHLGDLIQILEPVLQSFPVEDQPSKV